MVASAETLVRSMDDFSRVGQGRVRIWANISAVVQFLPRDLYAFQATHPRIRIELEERFSEETLHALRSGDIDVGIVADNKLSAGLLQRPYREDRLVVVVPRDHPVAQLGSVGFGDIADLDLVGFNHGSDILRRLDGLANAEGKLLRIRVRATSFEAVLSLVEAGHGLGVLPRAVVSSRLSDRHLAAIPIHQEWARRRLWITFRGSGGTGAETDCLIRFLKDRTAP
ncbi:LysR substrate-binding domain-containing protein [Methylobacterium pseudosasicola]|uniref:DNA-binding transcriptional regulator, LysR family n=1 Tax=Methylobacterium pseudosasicola TaxID=582667 RepID=A0A1I4UMB9_9HYPH|nr:LysR substrate-binding domain-containing protein [Methylobacterium pseudosasicola]SFM89890.1 DNA-binding transcriptional regulator, LysR family [Methylobacterium pseudosasicola]